MPLPHLKGDRLLEFSNAFNRVDSGTMFQQVRDHISTLAALMEMCYGHNLFSTLVDTPSSAAVESSRWNLLPHWVLNLSFTPLLHEQVLGLLIHAWFLNDGTLCGSAKDLQAALTIIEEDGSTPGLHLNRSKSLLYIPTGAHSETNTLPAVISRPRGI